MSGIPEAEKFPPETAEEIAILMGQVASKAGATEAIIMVCKAENGRPTFDVRVLHGNPMAVRGLLSVGGKIVENVVIQALTEVPRPLVVETVRTLREAGL